MNQEKKENNKPWWFQGVNFFYKTLGWIFAPAIIAFLLGKYFDVKYNSSPKFILIFIGIAFLITNIGLISETVRYNKTINKINEKRNESKKE